MVIQEQYSPQLMTANSSFTTGSTKIGGFICTVSGTLDIVGGDGLPDVSALPVTAGSYHPLPIFVGNSGATITLSGGAAGTLLI